MNAKNANPINEFYTQLFDIMFSEFKVCITCKDYEYCEKSKHYLDHCQRYIHFSPKPNNSNLIKKPMPTINIHTIADREERDIKIECIGEKYVNFILNEVCKYGKLYEIGKPRNSKNNDIRYFSLTVSNLYHFGTVLEYIKSFK